MRVIEKQPLNPKFLILLKTWRQEESSDGERMQDYLILRV